MTKKVRSDVFKVGDQVDYYLTGGGKENHRRHERGVIIKDCGERWSIKIINKFGEQIFKNILKNRIWGAESDKNKLGENKALSSVSQRSKA